MSSRDRRLTLLTRSKGFSPLVVECRSRGAGGVKRGISESGMLCGVRLSEELEVDEVVSKPVSDGWDWTVWPEERGRAKRGGRLRFRGPETPLELTMSNGRT